MKRLILATALLGLTGAVNSAHAVLITPITAQVWTAPTPGANSGTNTQQALPSAIAPIVASTGSFNSGQLAYTNALNLAAPPSIATINSFLQQPGFCAATPCDVVGGLSGTQGAFNRVSLFEFRFTTTGSGVVSVMHDDGISLFADGNTTTNLIPGVSAPQTVNGTDSSMVLAAGTYDLFYTAANGLPENLNAQFTPVTSAPEPASLTLIGSALVGLGWLSRRRRKAA